MTGARHAGSRAAARFAIVLVSLFVAETLAARDVEAQSVTGRGFVEAGAVLFPRGTANDRQHAVVDLRVRQEVFATLTPWLRAAGGVDLRANSHDQVSGSWVPDVRDRGFLRPPLSIRRLSATAARGPITLDLGKQFIRWGKTDIVTPTDRFAPRDFLDVVNNEFLPVTGARLTWQQQSGTIDAVWVPVFTPSRVPLLDQRWSSVPASGAGLRVHEAGAVYPGRAQAGLRWSRQGSYEYSVSLFDGFNHLPTIGGVPGPGPFDIGLVRSYPSLRTYGGDAAVPTKWLTAKAEAAWFTSRDPAADEYVLYVLQLERQTGEWLLTGGYAGEAVTKQRSPGRFAPDRGMTRSVIARASYTIGPTRSAAAETAIRQDGGGLHARGEYSWATGQHWRTTVTAALLAGADGDFIGQYRRNSNATVTLRYSY